MNITGITIRKQLQRSGLVLGLIGVVSFTLLLSACNTGYYGDWSPAWSPDGTKIAFHSTRGGEWAFYVMNADGSKQTNLTNSAGGMHPAWSPDGTKIAYSSCYGEIYTINADGSNRTNLTKNSAGGSNPVWSPDGTKIAFQSNRTGDYEIYVMNSNGSNQINLTQNIARDTEPTWSPDGAKIAFVSDRSGDYEIYVMNADGTNPTILIDSPATAFKEPGRPVISEVFRISEKYPAWSPDGTKIAFFCKEDIYVVDADGTNLTNLTTVENFYPNPKVFNTGVSWSPDGTKIAHARYRADFESMYIEIYVMDADGSNAVRLTYKSDVIPILSLIGKVVGPPVAIILLIIWLRRRRRRAVS